MNLLVTSSGRRVELLSLLRQALHGRVVAADMDPTAPTLYLADAGTRLPPASATGYLDTLVNVCRRHDVSVILPTIDVELEPLAAARAELADQGVRVIVSSAASVRRCLDKWSTFSHLTAGGVECVPTVVWSAQCEVPRMGRDERVVTKPRRGSSGHGVRIMDRSELPSLALDETHIAQPFVDAAEATVDVVCREGRILAMGARQRLKVRGGEVDRGITIPSDKFLPLARRLVDLLELDGILNFQVFLCDDGVLLSEVNPRIGGGLPLSERAGGGLLRAALSDDGGRPDVPVMARPGVWMLRYDSSVYLEPEGLLW